LLRAFVLMSADPGAEQDPVSELKMTPNATGTHQVYGVYDRVLLETMEYLAARCSGVTRYVIFHAAAWNAMAWVAHREALLPSAPKLPF